MLVEIGPEWAEGEGLKANETLKKAVEQLQKSRDQLFDCALSIPKWLKDVGFIDIKVNKRHCPMGKKHGELGETGAQTIAMFYRNVKSAILQGAGFGLVSSEEEYDGLLDEAITEWDAVGPYFVWYLITARKPMAIA